MIEIFCGLFAGLLLAVVPPARSAPVHLVEEPPVQNTAVAPNVFLVDFGRVAFGNLQFFIQPEPKPALPNYWEMRE
jgi:hypothetical protein